MKRITTRRSFSPPKSGRRWSRAVREVARLLTYDWRSSMICSVETTGIIKSLHSSRCGLTLSSSDCRVVSSFVLLTSGPVVLYPVSDCCVLGSFPCHTLCCRLRPLSKGKGKNCERTLPSRQSQIWCATPRRTTSSSSEQASIKTRPVLSSCTRAGY